MHCAQVAIKFMQRGEKLASVYVEREIINHSILLHPHIIQFKQAGVTCKAGLRCPVYFPFCCYFSLLAISPRA